MPAIFVCLMYFFVSKWPLFSEYITINRLTRIYLDQKARSITMKLYHETLYGPRQTKRYIRACAKCTNSDSSHVCAKSHPGNCSPSQRSIVSCPMIQFVDRKGPDQPARMHRLIWDFPVRIIMFEDRVSHSAAHIVIESWINIDRGGLWLNRTFVCLACSTMQLRILYFFLHSFIITFFLKKKGLSI